MKNEQTQTVGRQMPPKTQKRETTELMKEVVEYFGSQKATAEAAGVKQPSVSDWVTGRTKPSLRALLRIQKKSKGRFKAKELRPELFV